MECAILLAWKGKVIDEKTGKSVDGVAIVRSWDRVTVTPAGTVTRFHSFDETLSDKNGELKITIKYNSFGMHYALYLFF